MRKQSPLARALFALLALAIIAMPLSGAHLHLCFDGSEPPTTFHAVEDSGADHAPAINGTHNDRDVSLQGQALAKKQDRSVDLPSLLTATFLFVRLPISAPSPVSDEDVASPVSLRVAHLLPPLRGPPV